MQERRNSIANALELPLSCTNPLIYKLYEMILRYFLTEAVVFLEFHVPRQAGICHTLCVDVGDTALHT